MTERTTTIDQRGARGSSPVRHTVETTFGTTSVLEAGTGAPALFVHGVLMNAHLWDGVIALVADRRRCFAPDLMGHGDSATSPTQRLDFGAQADMLAECIVELDLGPVDLVGNDSGGAIVQVLSARHPELVSSLVLTNCDTGDNVLPEPFVEFARACAAGQALAMFEPLLDDLDGARALLAQTFVDPARISEDTLRALVEPLVRNERQQRSIERWMTELTADDLLAAEKVLGQLDVPAMLVWGDDDVFFPMDEARRLAALLGGAELVVLPGQRLLHPLEAPHHLAGALRPFWAHVDAERSG